MMVIDAHSLAVDESSMTGETNAIKKNAEEKMFCFSGTKVMEGEGRCVVCAVGTMSQYGILQMALRSKVKMEDDEGNEIEAVPIDELPWPKNKRWLFFPRYPDEDDSMTPLQEKLTKLADQVGLLGLAAAVLTFLALLIKWGIGEAGGEGDAIVGNFANMTRCPEGGASAEEGVVDVLHFFITAVTIVVVAVPEGLPLAVTIALAYSQRKMMKDNNLVRVLAGNVTFFFHSFFFVQK